MGLHILKKIVSETFNMQERKLLLGNKDVSKIKKEIIGYRRLIENFIDKLTIDAKNDYEISQRIESLSKYSEIVQVARDGIIIKQERRIEQVGEEKKEITYDTTMSPREVSRILIDYEKQSYKTQMDKLDNYLGLGLSLASIIGAVINEKGTKDQEKGLPTLISLGSISIGGLKLIQGTLNQNDNKNKFKVIDKEFSLIDDLLENEQISTNAQTNAIQNIETLANEEKDISTKIEDKKLAFNTILDLSIALLSGIYVNSKIQTNDNKKIDGKSLASALVSLKSTKQISAYLIKTVESYAQNKKQEEIFEQTCIKIREIWKQMEEKVYPLNGAKKPFDSMQITDFTGKFYPKKDYETGETHYSTIIKIPEFSMKRGDVVLLSGESGSGKSTFLRLLKRGDINNRKAIKLDNDESVDSLGNEYISFRPSINLGDEANVLYQITGKTSISDLTEDQKEHLLTILRELKFKNPNLLKDLASKKFMEFSTGQQRRLALSKLFYRVDDGTSVIIVDEPVGNVEDNLIREQLEMIKRYAESKNVMLILTTHRLDLAEDLANKRYNINNEGILEEIPIYKKANIER